MYTVAWKYVPVNTVLQCQPLLHKLHEYVGDSVPALAYQNCPSLLTQAQQIADRHRESLLRFSSCHNIYQQNYIDGDKAEELCKFRKMFVMLLYYNVMAYFPQPRTSRSSWPTTIGSFLLLPKVTYAWRACCTVGKEMADGFWATRRTRSWKYPGVLQLLEEDLQWHPWHSSTAQTDHGGASSPCSPR